MLIEEADYQLPFATEIATFLDAQAFERYNLNKVVSHALETETEYRDWLTRHHFGDDGTQREMLYVQGRWTGITAYSRYRSATSYAIRATGH